MKNSRCGREKLPMNSARGLLSRRSINTGEDVKTNGILILRLHLDCEAVVLARVPCTLPTAPSTHHPNVWLKLRSNG